MTSYLTNYSGASTVGYSLVLLLSSYLHHLVYMLRFFITQEELDLHSLVYLLQSSISGRKLDYSIVVK